jgi:glycyl-radical enzyme activating protein
MKGCPLKCAWCSNPESQSTKQEVMFFEEKCIDCGACQRACPYGDVHAENWPLGRDICNGCGNCVDVCYAEARTLVGRWMTREEILETIRRDRVFYDTSHGGVTVGGGEPTMQAKFVAGLLEACRAEGLHTAIETCGFTPWDNFESVISHVDQLLMDIKHMDSDKHKKWTGVGNEQILENARRAVQTVEHMVIRLPLIPGFNDDEENLRKLGRFVADELPGVDRLDILPYHSTGESKSKRLDREYSLNDLETFERSEIDKIRAFLQKSGIEVRVG